MYIPELDALVFLATEFLGGGVDQPHLQAGIKALYEAAGTTCMLPVPGLSGQAPSQKATCTPYRSRVQAW